VFAIFPHGKFLVIGGLRLDAVYRQIEFSSNFAFLVRNATLKNNCRHRCECFVSVPGTETPQCILSGCCLRGDVVAAYSSSGDLFPLLGFDDSPARIIVVVLAIGFIPALILAWAFDKFVLAPQREAREQQQQTVELEVARQAGPTEALVESYGDKSIAVLPFTDMSPTCLRDQSGKPATISALLRNWSRPVQIREHIPNSG